MDPPAFAIPTDEDISRLDATTQVADYHEYPKLELPRPPFALVIGIDKYQNYQNLTGAVKDANNVAEFLITSMGVSQERMIKLLDHAATAEAIIKAIRSLATSTEIVKGDPILVYFAGHGGRAIAPQGWETADGRIEIICPVDMSVGDIETPTILGIPDIMLNMLITEIATQKGNNITVIFDCCHAASGLRGGDNATAIRGIDQSPMISEDRLGSLQLENSNFGGEVNLRSLDCSVLLAACGRLETAGENSDGGLFTQRLLETIRGLSSDQLRRTTYKELIRCLFISNWQHPQCESSQPHRYIFRNELADQCFISGRKDEGDLVLDAGTPLGIDSTTEFDIYRQDKLSPDNASCGKLVAKSVSRDSSILTFADGTPEFEIPDTFFAIQACFPEENKIKVYCTDSKKLNEAFQMHQRGFSGFAILVNTTDEADLLVSFSDCIEGEKCKDRPGKKHQNVYFDWADRNIVSQLSSTRIGNPVPLDNPTVIYQVFQAAARFHYYLYQKDEERNDQIKIALHLLKTETVKIQGAWGRRRKPIGENILKDGLAEIRLFGNKPVGPFGLTIYNHTDQDLLPQVFWFEGQNLEIIPWYTNQCGAGEKATIDPPLPARTSPTQPGEFYIGHGEVHNQAWGFTHNGGGKAVGFFKVFIADFIVDLEFLTQKSPFDDPHQRKALRRKPDAVDWWATHRMTVVQLPP